MVSAIPSMIIRSRSHQAVQDGSDPPKAADSGRGEPISCWENLPPDLLREVIKRIEESANSWPRRKSVVACAGVCRTWRNITKDLVKVPEISGKLTFPISVKQPGPRDTLLQCFIKRCPVTRTYFLYLSLTDALADDGKFLLAARKCSRPTFTNYIISFDADDLSKGSNTYVGKLRSNFLGTKFTVFDSQPPHAGAKMEKSRSNWLMNLKQVSPRVHAGNYPVCHISYEPNVSSSRSGPGKMHCVLDSIPATIVEPGGTLTWLNYHGPDIVASVKNFQLVASQENRPVSPEHEMIILQFGKVGKDLFTMDYRYPISAFQAFAICLNKLNYKGFRDYINLNINLMQDQMAYAYPYM